MTVPVALRAPGDRAVAALREAQRSVRRRPLVRALRSRLRPARRWWRRRPPRQARLGLAVVALAALLSGMGAGALVVPSGADDGAPEAGVTATRFGPVSVELPEALAPWVPVPAARMDEVREAAEGGTLTLDGAWGAVAPDDVLVTVMTAPVGSHGGVASVTGPFDVGRLEPPWRGDEPHRAGIHVADGVREGVLALEAPDGHLVVLSFSGPVEVLDETTVASALRSVRLPG